MSERKNFLGRLIQRIGTSAAAPVMTRLKEIDERVGIVAETATGASDQMRLSQRTIWQTKGDQTVDGVEKEADLSRLADGLGLETIEMSSAAR